MSKALEIVSLIERLRPLNEMANLYPIETGIDIFMYVSPDQGKHGPRVKIANTKQQLENNDTLSISIDDNPEIVAGDTQIDSELIEQVRTWIKVNRNTLMDFWDGKISSRKRLLKELTKYGETPQLQFEIVDMSKFSVYVAQFKQGNEPQLKIGYKDNKDENKTLTLNIDTGKTLNNNLDKPLSHKEYNDIKVWLTVNRTVLMKYWNHDISLQELSSKLKK